MSFHEKHEKRIKTINMMMNILKDLAPLNRVMCSSDYDKTIDYLQRILPFKVIEYSSRDEYNGWVIPPKWDVKEAKIIKDGKVIYDGLWHPLAVIALSASIRSKIRFRELKGHLHYDHRYDDSLTFHFRQQFRSWNRDWGFCVTKSFYDSLTDGEYEVIIETVEGEGILRMLEYTHQGALDESIAICANLDHPGVANDGISGVAVGIELFRRMVAKKTKFTYKLILAQGIIGTEYYLGKQHDRHRESILECACLWMLGSRTDLALQASRESRTNIEHTIAYVMDKKDIRYRKGDFESIIINDEYIWEAYDIPTCSLSRMPYPEYHSSRDNCSIMSEEALEEVVLVLEESLDILDSSPLVCKKFKGNICLSNPRYNLYIDPGQVSFGDQPDEERKKLRLLMDMIPTLRRPVTIKYLADRIGLEQQQVNDYLLRWAKKGLLDII
jgi:aminopeptidase-like protein